MPAVLAAVGIHSLLNQEFLQLWHWDEEEEAAGTEEEAVQQIEADEKAQALQETRKDR